jgi:hypothetical protein
MLLARKTDEDPAMLVEAAKTIWKEAVRSCELEQELPALAHEVELVMSDRISFREIALRRLVPNSRTSGEVKTANGIRIAAKRFYDRIQESFRIQGQQLEEAPDWSDKVKIQGRKRIAVELRLLRAERRDSLRAAQLPHSRLDDLIEFQRQQRERIAAARAAGKRARPRQSPRRNKPGSTSKPHPG